MPLKLNSNSPKIFGGRINRKMVKEMITFYRTDRMLDEFSLKFSHFTAIELLDLLSDNGVINRITDPVQRTKVGQFGVKIYMGNHGNDPNTCPAGRENSYLGYDTTIVCNTNLVGKKWKDMLKNNTDFISFTGAGDGEDKGSICPPDCPPKPDPDGFIHEDVFTQP